ncbi:hypothetical protein KQI41_01230 [Tissierella pigra]|uniref:hypothetical protein n=1 Tax=Tissierella pigra TaxID=2607614 RepID=UPI001C109126|nr:hypothetical protein [Tissierella pigra]MBU5425018.1 hypothetical protein [Tissierella pigra]
MASFKGYSRKIKLEFDYDQVKEGIPNVKKQMAVLNAEFKRSSAEAEASGKEIDKLGTRYDYLGNKLKIQEKEVENYKKKLEDATNAKGNNTKAIENNTASLQIAEAKLAQTRAELDKVSQELEKQKTILGKTSEEWKDLSEKTTEIGKSMTLKLTTPIVAAAGASFKLGADFEQALGKMDVVFENNARNVEKWAQNSLRDFGLARSTAITMAGDFGALFKGMGINMQKTEEWSKTLTERTMDLSNFYDTTVEETTRALNAIVTGQTEPLRRFGINMTQATLAEYARQKGIRKSIQDMTEAEKVQLRYNFVIERTNIAVGTTARESDTATGQLNRFKEGVKELGEGFSQHILPMFVPVIDGLNNTIEKIAGLSDGTKKFIVVVGGIVAAVGPVLLVLGKVFGTIRDISEGMQVAKRGVEAVSKVGGLFKGALDNTQFFGFLKWALIIGGIVALIAFLINQLNVLLGKGKEANQALNNLGDIAGNVTGTANRGRNIAYQYIDGSHRDGLDYVKRDGYIAELHEGERVLTKEENQRYSQGGGDTYILQVNMDEVDEVYKLVEVFKDFKSTRRAGVI